MTYATTVTDTDFEEAVLRSDQPVLVDFWATWCPPCRVMGPVVEDLARRYSGRAKVAKLDVDDNPIVARSFGIQSIPTLMLFHGGDPIERRIGVQPRGDLESLLERALAAAG
jgi:thioredoxin 1